MKTALWILSTISLVIINACCDKESINQPPEISSLTADPDTLETNAVSKVTCVANDPEGSDLIFTWECAAGSLNGTGSEVNWMAPANPGEYYIRCEVDDGDEGVDEDSVKVYVYQPLPVDGLIVYYPFNGNANDESGNEIHGTVSGPTLAADRHGNENSAYSFDGENDYIEADATKLPTAERTVSIWFYSNSVENRPGLLGYGGGGGGRSTSWLMGLNLNGLESFHLSCHYLANRIDYYYENEPVNQWFHWVITTSSGGTKIFVDGVEKESNDTFINNTYVKEKQLGIGVVSSTGGLVPYVDGNVKYFDGVLDDIRIYNRALSLEEIQLLYNENQ